MNRLDRYIIRHVLTPSLLALAVISVVFVSNDIREYMRELPASLITANDLSRLSLFLLPSLIPFIIPATFLLGILLTFSRLAQQGEIIAMRAAGISLKRMVVPVLLAGALLSGLTFLIQDRLQPWAVDKAYDLIYSELPKRATLDTFSPGVMHEFADGWRVYFESKDPNTLTLYEVELVRPEPDGATSVFHAESAQLIRLGTAYELAMTDARLIWGTRPMVRSDTWSITVPAPQDAVAPSDRTGRTLVQLLKVERGLTEEYEAAKHEPDKASLKKERREIGERVSLPFASLAVALIGATAGVRARRRGRAYTFGIGFAIILVYYVLQVLMTPSSLHSLPDIILRAWTPNLVLGLVGIVLLWRVDRV